MLSTRKQWLHEIWQQNTYIGGLSPHECRPKVFISACILYRKYTVLFLIPPWKVDPHFFSQLSWKSILYQYWKVWGLNPQVHLPKMFLSNNNWYLNRVTPSITRLVSTGALLQGHFVAKLNEMRFESSQRSTRICCSAQQVKLMAKF